MIDLDRRTSIESLAARAAPGDPVCIAGRVTSVDPDRARIEDETGAIVVAIAAPLRAPALGAWVAIAGSWDGATIARPELEIVHAAPLPFPRVRGEWVRLHDERRRRMRVLRARAAILRAIRAHLDGEGFLEVETPAAVPSPGLDLHLDAFALANAREPRFLITSPEYQMKRLLAGGLERIYQICRCFRRNERGSRHQPEFTMLEWYRALSGSESVMRDTEELVAAAARAVLGTTRVQRADGSALELAPPWDRMTVEDAFRAHAGIEMESLLADEDRFFLTLAETIEPRLGRDRPVFLVEWPASMASLARLIPGRADRADRFEAFVSGMELCNGFGELVDPVEQRARLERDRRARAARGLAVFPIDEKFLAALEEGVPPSGGNALGIDRLVMLLLGEDDIDDVVALSDARL